MKLTHMNIIVLVHITASMGLICKNANDITDNVYKEADDLLYEKKKWKKSSKSKSLIS